VARELTAWAVPGTATDTGIALKYSFFHSLPRVSILFNFNNKNINTPLRGNELAKYRPLRPLRASRLWGQRLMPNRASAFAERGV
jgi:hypothetical protein